MSHHRGSPTTLKPYTARQMSPSHGGTWWDGESAQEGGFHITEDFKGHVCYSELGTTGSWAAAPGQREKGKGCLFTCRHLSRLKKKTLNNPVSKSVGKMGVGYFSPTYF